MIRVKVKDLRRIVAEALAADENYSDIDVTYDDSLAEPEVTYHDDELGSGEPEVDYEDPYGRAMLKTQCDTGMHEGDVPLPSSSKRATPPPRKPRVGATMSMRSLAKQKKDAEQTNRNDADFFKFKSLAKNKDDLHEKSDDEMDEGHALGLSLGAECGESCPACGLDNEGHGFIGCNYRECGDCGAELLPDEECENCSTAVDRMPANDRHASPKNGVIGPKGALNSVAPKRR